MEWGIIIALGTVISIVVLALIDLVTEGPAQPNAQPASWVDLRRFV